MSAESSDPVRPPATGRVSGLIPAGSRKNNSRNRGGARRRKQDRKPPPSGADGDRPAAPETDADDHSVDYLA